MKKILMLLLFIFTFTATSCNNKNNLIKKQVLYDENDIKITANSLEYEEEFVKLFLTFENNTYMDLSISCITSGKHVINGWMGILVQSKCEANAHKAAEGYAFIERASLEEYNISEIAVMEICFDVFDGMNLYLNTGLIRIETSVFENFDFNVNTYQQKIENNDLENTKIIKYSNEVLYNTDGLSIESFVCYEKESTHVLSNKEYNYTCIEFEIKNNTDKQMDFILKDFKVNNIDSYHEYKKNYLMPHTSRIISINMKELISSFNDVIEEAKIANKLTFTFGILNYYSITNEKEISIELPDVEILL